MTRILTFYLTRESVDRECYNSVLNQKGVEQNLIVVSAKKIDIPNDFVVEIPEEYPLPVRVGLSINRALSVYWDLRRYDYFFKVDGDVEVAPDYLSDIVSKRKPIMGPGSAMLIDARFFEEHFGSKWAICYCDDMYMKAYSFAHGFIDTIWEENLKLRKSEYNPPNNRMFIYGKEFYKFGSPFWFMLLTIAASIRNRFREAPGRITVTKSMHSLGGYLSEIGTRKYKWHSRYAKQLTRLYFHKTLSALT